MVDKEEVLEAMTSRIEGKAGCWTAVWHEWPSRDIFALYCDVCKADINETIVNQYRKLFEGRI